MGSRKKVKDRLGGDKDDKDRERDQTWPQRQRVSHAGKSQRAPQPGVTPAEPEDPRDLFTDAPRRSEDERADENPLSKLIGLLRGSNR